MRIIVAALVGLVLTLPPLSAQEGTPDGWMVRTDRPGQSAAEIAFTDMPPGWHVTTGPAAILWHPDRSAEGEFRVEMEVYLFDPGERREAFGFFLGGADLDGDGQRYLYFLVREGGEFLIKRRSGADTEVVVDWTAAPSVVSYASRGDDEATAKNVLAVEASEDTVRFLVNGDEVASLPRTDVDPDGLVGLRVNHGLNLHVSRLDVDGG